jgi:hypothetical protein
MSRLKYALSLRVGWESPTISNSYTLVFSSSTVHVFQLTPDPPFSSNSTSIPLSRQVGPNIRRTQDVSVLFTEAPSSPCVHRGNICCTSTSFTTLSSSPRRPWQIVIHLCHENLSTSEQRVHCSCEDEPEQLQAKCTCGRGGAEEHEILSSVNLRKDQI